MTRPVAIVLGAAVWPGGVASPALRRRAEMAAALYREGKVGRIIATGGLGTCPPTEAEVTRQILISRDVPAAAITLEMRSRNTFENLTFARVLLPPGSPVVIVTDPWHLPRAHLVARRIGLAARGAAPSLKGAHPLRTARAILREAAAFVIYLLRPRH